MAYSPWLLKPLFGRARPDVTGQLVGVTDLSFPSGHAFGATAIYLFLLLYGLTLLSRPLHQIFWIAFVAILIGLVGISRIYLGVHHATDVFGGIAAGAAWAFSIAFVFELTRHRSRL